MSNLEILASITGFASVWFTVKKNILLYPIGILSCILFAVVFYEVKLYSDAALQIVFVLLQIYGWYYWKYSKTDNTINIASKKEMFIWIAILGAFSLSWGWMMSRTDAALPYIDASVLGASLIAQYFIAKKYIQNWTIWIAVDIVSIPVYAYKELYLTSFLYFVFLILASYGAYTWHKEKQAS